MTAFSKVNSFVEALAEKKHNLGADTLKLLLSNTAPDPATATVKADVTEITPGNGYTMGGMTITVTASAQTAGIYKLVANDLTITAAGGTIGPFQYVVLYNDSATNDELIGFWDFGSPVTLADGEGFPIDFSGTNGVLQLS